MSSKIWLTVALSILSAGCSGPRWDRSPKAEPPIGNPIKILAPLGLPPVPVPSGNPPTVATIALGRKLFYDQRLSSDNSVACATCHTPELGFADGRQHSTGVGGAKGERNAPTVLNAAYAALQFWDGRARGLEMQALGPITNPKEMNLTPEACASKLASDPAYVAEFAQAFGPGPITIGKIESAIASFERTVISGNSPFDRYRYGGETKALSMAAIRGLAAFVDPARGNCATCHAIDEKFALFTDGKFHNIGAGVTGEGEISDVGRYAETHVDSDKGAFRTPTLRNIASTAPYMHDGSLKTLKQVVDFYAGGGNSNPYLDKAMRQIRLTGRDRDDLVEFLQSLTGEMPANVGPPTR